VGRLVAHAAIALAIAACGCAHTATPQELADATTRAVYDADYDRTTERFDDALKTQVTRASVGQLSDRMRALGAYHGLRETAHDTSKGRYDYEAAFDKGTMAVMIRLGPDSKLAAYRVAPQSSPAAPAR
jgi:hypothetical protein